MKACFDDFTGQPFPEDENNETAIVKRVGGKLLKCTLDLSPQSAQKILDMLQNKPPKWEVWVNASDEEKAKNAKAKGHWEPVPSGSTQV